MPPQPNQRTEQVPIEACRFATEFKPGKSEGDNKPVPFTSLARTGKPVPHWFWGPRTVHDFSGMEAAESIPVDWNHNEYVEIGVVTSHRITAEGLEYSGVLLPFQPDDKASEIIHKAAYGMPYQGSIYFDPWNMMVEDVPEGFSAEVNGETFSGPLTIFRKWKWLGQAVCLYGVDDGTSIEVSKLSGQKAAITRFSKGVSTVADPTPATTPLATPPAETKPPETPPATPPVETKPPETPATTPPTQLSRKEQSAKFLTTFGATHGATLFAKHDKFEDAQAEYLTILKAENDALRAENAKFAKGPQGEAPASPGVVAGNPATKTKFSNLGTNLGRLAAAIKIPGKQ